MFNLWQGQRADIAATFLCYRLTDNLDEMMHYRDIVAKNPAAQFRMFDHNPIHLGFFLDRFTPEGTVLVS